MPGPVVEAKIAQMQKTSVSVPADAHLLNPQSEIDRKRALLAKVRTIREFSLGNRSAVLEGDPSKAYCWVNTREERQVFYKGMGWELVTADTGPNVKTHYRQPDGTHRRADVVLYHIDKELYEAICTEAELRGLEAIEGAKQTFAVEAERQTGAPVFQPRVR